MNLFIPEDFQFSLDTDSEVQMVILNLKDSSPGSDDISGSQLKSVQDLKLLSRPILILRVMTKMLEKTCPLCI